MKKELRHAFHQFLVDSQNKGWWFTPKTEPERQKWLDKNMTSIFSNFGNLIKSNNQVFFEFCSAEYAQDNAFYGCVQLPAKPYLKRELQNDA